MRRRDFRAGANGFEIGVRAPVEGYGCVLESEAGAKAGAVCAVIIHDQLRALPVAKEVEVTAMLAEIDGIPLIEAKSDLAAFGGAPAVIDCAG